MSEVLAQWASFIFRRHRCDATVTNGFIGLQFFNNSTYSATQRLFNGRTHLDLGGRRNFHASVRPVLHSNPKRSSLMKDTLLKNIRLFLLPVLVISIGAAFATAGTITGRVINPATGEYVRNAKVEIKKTGQVVYSGYGGEYRLPSVAAGSVTLSVTYTGFRVNPATVEVPGDGTVTQDFEIVSTGADSEQAITLDRFVVSSAREGNAKAIMEQRSSMNVTNTVATDAYGENPEGNVSEFLRFLPGVSLDSNFGEGRYVNMRGLGSAYTSVTMDGVSMASTDASNTGGSANGRSFSFEQAAISSVDSVEVSKTISADSDANASTLR